MAANGAVAFTSPLDNLFSDQSSLDDLLWNLGSRPAVDPSQVGNATAAALTDNPFIGLPVGIGEAAGGAYGAMQAFGFGATAWLSYYAGPGGGFTQGSTSGLPGDLPAGYPYADAPDALPIPHTAETDFGTTTAPSAAFAITIDPAAAGGSSSSGSLSAGATGSSGESGNAAPGAGVGGIVGMATSILAQAAIGAGGRDGHHWIPQSVYEALSSLLRPEAKDLFEAATLDPIFYDHGADTWNKVTHPQYTSTMKSLLQEFIKLTTGGKRQLYVDEAQVFLEMVRDGKNLDLPFAVKYAAELKTVIAWRNGFLDSVALAKGFVDKAAELSATLTKEEVKAMTQGWLGQSNKKLSANAAKVSNALREELKLLDPAARQAKFGLLRKAAALAVAYSIIQAASDAYAADGTMQCGRDCRSQ